MADPTTPTTPPTPVRPVEISEPSQQPKPEPPPETKPAPAPHDLFQPLNEDLQSMAEHQLRSPASFAQKIPVHPRPAERPEPHPSLDKPIDPRPLLNDPMFRSPQMKDTPLYRHLQARVFEPREKTKSPLPFPSPSRGEGLREGVIDNRRQNLRMLLASRNLPWQGENKKVFRELVHEELREAKTPHEETLSKEGLAREGRFQPFFKDVRGLMSRLSEATNSFEEILKEMFSGKELVPNTPTGKEAQFMGKTASEWNSFFSNMLNMGNAETPVTRNMAELAEALFRGLYQQTLVSDLNFADGKKVVADKFARILVDNPDLLEALRKLNPGDKLPPDLLAKLGEKLSYVQLTHLPQVASTAAREAARDAALATLRNPANVGALALLEKALKKERRLPPGLIPSFLAQRGKTEGEIRAGRAKFWVYFAYSVAAAMAVLVGYSVFKGLF